MACFPLACWLVEQAGFVHTGLLAACGALFAVYPGGVRCMHVDSMVPSLVGRGGAWIRPPDRERIYSEYPSIHPSIHTYIQTYIHTFACKNTQSLSETSIFDFLKLF